MALHRPINIACEKSKMPSVKRPPDIDVMSMIRPSQLQEARRFIDGLHTAISKMMNSKEGRTKSMTYKLSHSVQVMKTNPVYCYARFSQADIDEIPVDLKQSFQKFPSEGFICECRVKDIYLGMGLSESKSGARSKASEQAMSVLAAMRVTVEPVQRRWKNQNYPDLVLTKAGKIREKLPPFFSPPVGIDDYRIEQDRMNSNMKPKLEGLKSSEGSSNHLGPPISGNIVENFVIVLGKNGTNPISVLYSSAQICKMSVDFCFEKERDGEEYICTFFIEGHAVADGKGVKKTLKLLVADKALKCLRKICHSMVSKESGLIRGRRIIYRKDIKNKAKHEEIKPKAVEENSVAIKMMKMMGWKDGEGLGASSTGIVEPIKVKGNFNRGGLGSKASDSDNITREEVRKMIEKYAASDSIEELTFSSELNFDERLEIKMMAKRYGLSERTVKDTYSGRKRTFLILSKKTHQLEKEGKWGKYQLVKPQGGDRYVTSKYLNYQDKRASKGAPPQILNQHSDAGMGRDIRIMGGLSNKKTHENNPDGWNTNRLECGSDRLDGVCGTSFGRGGGLGGLSRRGEQTSVSREAGRGIRPSTSVETIEVIESKTMLDDEMETTSLVTQDSKCIKTTADIIGNSVIPVSSTSSCTPVSSVRITEPVPSVINPTPLPSNVCTPDVGAVSNPVPVELKPVKDRNSARPIPDLQNQLQARSVKKESSVKQKEQGSRLTEWSEGDAVVARRPRLKGGGERRERSVSVTPNVGGEVKDIMDKNIAQLRQGVANSRHQDECKAPGALTLESTSKQSLEQLPLPPSNELASYSRTSEGSLHIQSVLNINDAELSSHVLSSLITSDLGPLSLMTSPKSSDVIQKLITVLPSTNLKPILNIVVANFTHLSMDSAGCKVVQALLEFSRPDQQSFMTSLLCTSKTLLTLVTDMHGTHVAQACLPHITSSRNTLIALVNALLGHTAMIGKHQCGTLFLQRLMGILNTHYPGAPTTCLLQEDILANMAQLVVTEPGSRLIQALLKGTQPAVLIRVARWIQENKKVVVITKATVRTAVEVLQLIVNRLGEEKIWQRLLDSVYRAFLELDKDSAEKKSMLMTAALHPVGHMFAKDMVTMVKYAGQICKTEVMQDLAENVDELCLNNFGGSVLKGLEGTIG